MAPLLVGALVLAACGDGPDRPATSPADGSDLPDGVQPVQFETAVLQVRSPEGRTVTVSLLVADTFERRTRGLMYRRSLPRDTSMLFVFPAETTSPFWNKDTPLDLDLAFLDASGAVQSVTSLRRLSAELVAPEQPYLYSAKLPQGWLAQQGLGVGARFLIPASIEGSAD